MNLLDMPIEIGVLIYHFLDTKSKINVYMSCKALRSFFAPCHARKLIFSRSCLATVKTINHEFFMDIGQHVQHLDLCGVPDINSNDLKSHIHRLTQLKYLDITFTNIYLSDIVEIFPKNLTDICMNFFKCPRRSKESDVWEKCRKVFKERQFVNIHFIVFELVDSDTPLLFLEGISSTNNLKITVTDNYDPNFTNTWELLDEGHFESDIKKIDINFSHLFYIFRNCHVSHKTAICLKGVSSLDFEHLEYIFIMYLETIVIYMSPMFKNLFQLNCSQLIVETCPCLPLNFMLDGNIVFKTWPKATTIFDENFFKSLLLELKDYFPTYVCLHKQITMKLTEAPSDWCCIDACNGFECALRDLPSKVNLTDFCRVDGSVIRCNQPITLSCDSLTLHNITFMRLSNILLKDDFFAVLFKQCEKLYTLDIYIEKRNYSSKFLGYTDLLASSIHLAKSLKNIRVTSEDIQYENLFGALGLCATLENVHISEYERAVSNGTIPVENILLLIEKCESLYSLFIETDMSPEMLTLLICPLREKALELNKDHLCIDVCDCFRGWNPFGDVFNPSPLDILD